MEWKCQDEIQLEHMPKKLLIQKVPDEIGFEYEFEYSREDTNGSQWAKTSDNFAYHIVEWIRVL